MRNRIVTAVKQRFSIRKLSIGAASVLLGTSLYFMGAGAPVVHAATSGESVVSSKSTDINDPVDVAKDPTKNDTDVNNAIDKYAQGKQEEVGDNALIRASGKKPTTPANTADVRGDQVDSIAKKLDNDVKNANSDQEKTAISNYIIARKREGFSNIRDGKDAKDFADQGLSVDDEKDSEINQISVDHKPITLLKGQSEKIDGIDVTHTNNMTKKEKNDMKINSDNKVIIDLQHDQCQDKEITVTYDNLNNSYYLENIDDKINKIKISKIERTFSDIQDARNIIFKSDGIHAKNSTDGVYDKCDGPQLIIYNDPSDGFFYNNITQVSVNDIYYDDKGSQIKFDTKNDKNKAWIFVTSLNANYDRNSHNVEKVRAQGLNNSPVNAEEIKGSTVTNHIKGWWYSDKNNWFNKNPDWDKNAEDNRFGFVGTVAFQYQPGMTLQYWADDSQWGSHWASMQTQVVSSLDQRVIIYDHIKDGTENVTGNDDVNMTVHYVMDDNSEAPSDNKQTLSFTENGIQDLVTKHIDWTTANSQTFKDVVTPKVAGYTPDQDKVTGPTVNFGDNDVEVTVTYSPNVQLGHINYIDDDTKKTLTRDNFSGRTNEHEDYTSTDRIQEFENKGYELVSNDYPDGGFNFDNNDRQDQVFNVHFKHGTVTVTTKNPQTPNTPINPDPQSPKYPKDISNTNSDVKRTIDYEFKDGKTAQPTVKDSLHFERTVVIDKVTGKVLSDTWTQSQDFNDVQTPAIQGYTPDRTVVSDKNIGHDHQDIIEHVVYSPDAQHMTITYIDDTIGKTLHTDKLDGVSDQDTKQTTSNTIKQYEDQHYKLISDSTNGQDLIFDHNDKVDQSYEVHFVHGEHAINQTTSPKQTIHYVYANGLARQGKVIDDNVQQLSFKRDGYNDEVTGHDYWNAWTPATSQYKTVDSPVIQGYTPDKSSVDGSTVNPTDKDIEITVTYYADKQTAHIIYVDKTTNATLASDDLSGKSDKDSEYNTEDKIGKYESQHYVLTEDETNGKNIIFDHNDKEDQTYYVYFVHGTQKVNRQDTVTSTINYKFEDGKTAQPTVTQTKHFSEDGVKDLVTGKIAWDEAKPQKFEDVATKSIVGYTPDKDNVVGSTVKFGDQDVEVTVTYHNNAQTAKITYIDDTEKKTLGSDQQNGKFDHEIVFEHDPAEVIKGLEEKGYKLVSDNFKPGVKYQNDNKSNIFEVHLVHTYEPVETSQTITETVHYIDANGKPVAPDHVATVVVKVTGTRDKVTDSITWNTPSTGHFDKVISPKLPNMIPDKKLIPGRDVQYGDSDITESVVYTPDEIPSEPEEPNKPDNSTSKTPEEPNKPDNSTSKTPEKPNKPDNSTSKTPEKPNKPSNLVSKTSEKPNKPSNLASKTSEKSNKSSKEVSKQFGTIAKTTIPEKPIDSRTVDNHVSAKTTTKRELPQTGTTANTGIWTGLVSIITSLGLLGASKKRKKN